MEIGQAPPPHPARLFRISCPWAAIVFSLILRPFGLQFDAGYVNI